MNLTCKNYCVKYAYLNMKSVYGVIESHVKSLRAISEKQNLIYLFNIEFQKVNNDHIKQFYYNILKKISNIF